MAEVSKRPAGKAKAKADLQRVAIRFAGDSGDGMQLTGSQFSDVSALAGNELLTLPDFPSEIRAPAGTVAGVSGYQVQFGSGAILTTGDQLDALVAMNPAALKLGLRDLRSKGIVIVDEDSFSPADLKKAGYAENPLTDGTLTKFQAHLVPMTRLTGEAVSGLGLTPREAERCRNMFALGLICWLYDRPANFTLKAIGKKFKKSPKSAAANERAFKAGYRFGETTEIFQIQYRVPMADLAPGVYRRITGNQAVALGMAAAAKLAGTPLFYASYPITPASEILHELSAMKNYGVITFQAEDEIAAMSAVIGASFGGALAATATSGPGMALKTEAIGLAVMVELPAVIVNVQRGGPSTGLPTKTEQSDLFQAVLGRNGECPVVVLAPATPADCFDITVEAFRIATRYMVPVVVLSDGYLSSSAEPWRVPQFKDLAPIPVRYPTDPATFKPYQRNADLARPWATPGTPGLMHRIGGLEKKDVTGEPSHDPMNHQKMCELRAAKVAGVQMEDPYRWLGDETGDLLIVGWGSSYGAIWAAVEAARRDGKSVSACHLRCLNPLPDLGPRLAGFKKVLVPEMNLGQLVVLLRARFLVDAKGLGKVQGRPFTISDIADGIRGGLAL